MRHERAKQLLKNAVYRSLGELTAAIDGNGGPSEPTLRVLMYHKVNPLPSNPLTVPPGLFDEQLGFLRDRGYTVVSLDAVLAHYLDGKPLPPKAVLLTFDDGYRDNLAYALPILERYGYEGVLFVPLAFVNEPTPLPHEERLVAVGLHNPTMSWEELLELDARGIRIESHGISHHPLAELDVAAAAREVLVSKLRLEERLGREVKAFSYVKGSEAHFTSVHPSLIRQAGYELGFTSVSGSNDASADRYRLHRYNVEPYSLRTFELVLDGACDLIAVKDTVAGDHVRRIVNAAFGTSSR